MIVDTSVLVALFDAQDPHHHRARKEAAQAATLHLPAPVLVEFLQTVFFRLRQGVGAAAARKATKQARREFLATPNVVLAFEYDEARAADLFDASAGLSYVDAVVVERALAVGTGLLTFDQRQARAWRRLRAT